MTIDNRSSLGRQLEVDEPLEYDLGQLDRDAGELIAARMDAKGLTREEAVTDLLNFAGRVLQETVVHIDVGPVYERHPEVRRAVEGKQQAATRRGQKMGVGKALTVLIVAGAGQSGAEATGTAKQKPTVPRDRSEEIADGIDDIIAGGVELMRNMFGQDRRGRDKSV